MKTLLVAVLSLSTLAAAAQTPAKKISDVAKFNSETVDLGKVKVGSPVTGTFTVTNISNAPLIIEAVSPSCGCTKSDYTKEPIAPGKTGVITATYNAAVVGNFNKTVYVKFAGIMDPVGLIIEGTVLASPPAAAPEAAAAKTN